MITRQYFLYREQGETAAKQYLLMPGEYAALRSQMEELGMSAAEVFERFTGRMGRLDISLVQELIEAAND